MRRIVLYWCGRIGGWLARRYASGAWWGIEPGIARPGWQVTNGAPRETVHLASPEEAARALARIARAEVRFDRARRWVTAPPPFDRFFDEDHLSLVSSRDLRCLVDLAPVPEVGTPLVRPEDP